VVSYRRFRVAQLSTLGGCRTFMKTPSLKTLIQVIGYLLLTVTGFTLFFTLEIFLFTKGDSIHGDVGYWPLFSLFLLLVSLYLVIGAPHLVRAIERRKSDVRKSHAA
jgi:hypothetical protein